MKQILMLTFLCAFIFGCQTKINSESDLVSDSNLPITIKIPPINAKQPLLYSDIFESIKFIPLETGEECLVGRIADIKCHDNKFFIRDYDDSKAILEFDEKGMFITKIGGIGNGPGEYAAVGDMAIDPWQNQIIISNPARKSLQYYDFEGKYIRDVKVDLYFRSFALCDQDSYYVNVDDRKNGRIEADEAGKLLLIDNKGQVLFSAFNKNIEFTFSHLSDPYFANKSVLYHPAFSSFIYEIQDQTVGEKYTFDFGKHAIPDNYLSSMPERELDRALRKTEYARISEMCEMENHLFFTFIFKGMVYQCIYSKKSQKIIMGNIMINDLYGLAMGMPPLTVKGNRLISYLLPMQMLYYKEHVGTSIPPPSYIRELFVERAKTDPRLSAKDLSNFISEMERAKFKMTAEEFSFIKSIDENDNPIIVEFTLKEF